MSKIVKDHLPETNCKFMDGLYVTIQIGNIFTRRLLCSFDHPEQGEIIAENLNKSWRRVCDADKRM